MNRYWSEYRFACKQGSIQVWPEDLRPSILSFSSIKSYLYFGKAYHTTAWIDLPSIDFPLHEPNTKLSSHCNWPASDNTVHLVSQDMIVQLKTVSWFISLSLSLSPEELIIISSEPVKRWINSGDSGEFYDWNDRNESDKDDWGRSEAGGGRKRRNDEEDEIVMNTAKWNWRS